MPKFQVEDAVWVKVALSPWLSRRFHAEPGRDYASAFGEGVAMAKFQITFTSGNRAQEEVEAEQYVDRPPFVDFLQSDPAGGSALTVARYRADEIRRILRLN